MNSINIDKIFNINIMFNSKIKNDNEILNPKLKVLQFRNHWACICASCGPMSVELNVEETDISYHMDRMINILISEDRNLPNNLANCGECMEYFLNKDCLRQLVNSSIKRIPPNGLIYVTIDFFSNLCSLLNENFLTKKAVYKPLITLLKYCYSHKNITEKYENSIIDLLFNISQKINIHPQLLNIFIYEDSKYYECILFDYLKEFIFSSGEVGDMARTSLMYFFTTQFEIFASYIRFINFPDQLIDNLCMIFNELPMNISEIDCNNEYIYHFVTLFSLIENIIMNCSMQTIRNSIIFRFNEIFLKKLFINKYVQNYKTPEKLEAISIYLYYIISKINSVDFSSCIISFIFEKFTLIKDTISINNENTDKEINLYYLIMNHIMVNNRNNSLATINMLIISCLLKQHYRYTISYLIPSIRSKVNSEYSIQEYSNHQYNSNSESYILINTIDTSDNESYSKETACEENIFIENKYLPNLKNEITRYIKLFNIIKDDFGNDSNISIDNFQGYIFDINSNSEIQLSGLNINNLNKHYPENKIKIIINKPNKLKAMELLDDEEIFSQLFYLLNSFFNNSPDFNLALTDAISQLLIAPEIYIFLYLINRDILDNKKESLYTIFTSLIEQRIKLLNSYQDEVFKHNSLNSNYKEKQDLLFSEFNKNSRILLEFIKEVNISIFEIQLKSEIFENY